MIFKNAELHNVAELTECADGTYETHRFPLRVERALTEGGKNANRVSTGVELRFRLNSDRAVIRLHTSPDEAQSSCAYVFHGSILGGWYEYKKYILCGEMQEIVVERAKNPEALRKMTEVSGLPFSSELVRLVFDNTHLHLHSIEGDVEPPRPTDTPKRTYLAYGSSITHGSIGISTPNYWTSQVATALGADLRNLGLAGSCRLEAEVADEIAAMGERGEWDFATLCMGINIMRIPESEAELLVRRMIRAVADRNPEKHIFCISPFYSVHDLNGAAEPAMWRRVIDSCVREYSSPYVHYVDGLRMLDGAWGLSADLVHPSHVGVNAIARGLLAEMSPHVGK